MKVIEGLNYDIYIYPDDHPAPHCHVRFYNGSESVVGLPLLNHICGTKIDKNVRKELYENIESLINNWEKLNPTKH